MRTRVAVGHWQNRRTVEVSKKEIAFQVTVSCGHCNTCSQRRAHVESVLASTPSQPARWEWRENPVGAYVIIPAKVSSLKEAIKVLNNTLHLSIREEAA